MLPLVALLSGEKKTLGWDTQELLGNVFKTLMRFGLTKCKFERKLYWKFLIKEALVKRWSFWKNNTWFYVIERIQPSRGTTLLRNGTGLSP
jgi:hypothetical protein